MMTARQFLLLKLIEECQEVSQRASKQIQFGAEETQASSGKSSSTALETLLTNKERLGKEVDDFLITLMLLRDFDEIPVVDPDEFYKRRAQKKEKLKKYFEYSQSLGFVNPGETLGY